jgi:lysophospholipase L1-like esterase
MLLTVLGGGLPYWLKFRSIFGANWPLWETSGTLVEDISGNGLNGTNTGATVGQPNFIDGRTSYLWDADADKVDVFSPALAALFNGAEGGISVWVEPSASLLTDGVFRRICEFIVDAQNKVLITRSNVNGQIYAQYTAGNVTKYLYLYGLNTTGKMNIILTWNKALDRVRLYFNGRQYRAAAGSLGTWVGALTGAGIGFTPGGTSSWRGNIGRVGLAFHEITPEEAKAINNIGPLKTYAVIGDSISANANNWIEALVGSYPGGVRSCLLNHAVAGHSIMLNLDAQVAAAAGDNADEIYLAIGTNDGNGGDMLALRAKVESGIDALRATNPAATIKYVGPPPRWTDSTGATPVNLANIRTAIQAACTAKTIPYIDTFDDPVWVAADTSDGTHPIASGTAKLVTRVMAS